MKKIVSLPSMTCLVLLLASSCDTVRQKIKREENSRFQYTQMAFSSDSVVRRWYFYSDSAFSYHPDSGLRTTSGRLLGWELNTKRRLEQQTWDSVSNYEHSAKELTRNGGRIQLVGHILFVLLAVVLVIVFWTRHRSM